MPEYIDKAELLRDLERKIKADNERRMAVVDSDFIDLVNDATVIEDVVEVIHGEWEAFDCISESKRGRTIHYATHKCSVCKKWNGRHAPNYCPRCGAKMDGERKEQE